MLHGTVRVVGAVLALQLVGFRVQEGRWPWTPKPENHNAASLTFKAGPEIFFYQTIEDKGQALDPDYCYPTTDCQHLTCPKHPGELFDVMTPAILCEKTKQ